MRKTGLRRAGAGCLFGILILVAAVGFAALNSTIFGAALVVVFVVGGYITIRMAK